MIAPVSSNPPPSRPKAPRPTSAGTRSLFDELGGEPKLRAIVDDFVDRVFEDVLIGFLFRSANRERIKAKEYEHAAEHLGAPVRYSGRPLRQAHAPHPILGGHFARRLQILRETLADHGAPEAVIQHFVAHTESLRSEITRSEASDCDHDAIADRRPK